LTFAFGEQRSSSRNMAWANDWPLKWGASNVNDRLLTLPSGPKRRVH
jgi:hypothetical protein